MTEAQNLQPGQVIQSKWKVVSKLGEGGFGAVYKVKGVNGNEEYAMKVEISKNECSEDCMLRMEAAVLKTFRNTKMPQPHICDYVESGHTPAFRFLVMQLVGRSLADLRKACPGSKFTCSTSSRLAIQTMEGIESLHRVGFLHRDIKPANFAMGRAGVQTRYVYLLDFGLARQYVDHLGNPRAPRPSAGFRGTVRYASINTHLRKDLGRHDDLWSWFYTIIEFHTGDLPWKKLSDKNEVMKKKKDTTGEQLCVGLEKEYASIFQKLQVLKYADTPNYAAFQMLLNQITTRKRYKMDDPFDWEEGGEGYENVMKSVIAADPYKVKEKADMKIVKERNEHEDKSRASLQECA